MKIIQVLVSSAALLGSVAAAPRPLKSGPNWEEFINELGYAEVRFKAGMGPGSEDYAHRVGFPNITNSDIGLVNRQEGRTTEPRAGSNEIPYGCDAIIDAAIFQPALDELCDNSFCDNGPGRVVEMNAKYPELGSEANRKVVVSAEGNYPDGQDGYKQFMIGAVRAMVQPDAVNDRNVRSDLPQNSPNQLPRTFQCNVPHASDFYQVVIRNPDDSQVAIMAVRVTFQESGNGQEICSTITGAGAAITSSITGLSALFGLVGAVACN